METKKWVKIFESEDYKVEIYDNCTTRVYTKAGNADEIKIEMDGTKWVGNTGEFHVYKYFESGDEAIRLINLIHKFDDDEASEEEVRSYIDALCL